MRYEIFCNELISELEKEIDERLASGWKLVGGVAVTVVAGEYTDSYMYFQAMAKEDIVHELAVLKALGGV